MEYDELHKRILTLSNQYMWIQQKVAGCCEWNF